MTTLNFETSTFYGDKGLIIGTDSKDHVYLDESNAWRHIDVDLEEIVINTYDGDDLITIVPPEVFYYEYWGGLAKDFVISGGEGNDIFVVSYSSSSWFPAEIVGGGGIDIIEADIAEELEDWRINRMLSTPDMVYLTNSQNGTFLSLDKSTEAVGSGSNWFLTKDMLNHVLDPKSFQSVLDDQIITGTPKKRDNLEGGTGSDEFLFGSAEGKWGKKILVKMLT